MPGRDVVGEERDHRGDQPVGGADPLGVAGLLRQRREHLLQVGVRKPDPAPFGRVAEQLLRDHQTQQLDIIQPGLAPWLMQAGEPQRGQDPVVEVDIECGQEGVEVLIHTRRLAPSANYPRTNTRAPGDSDSLI